VAVGAGAGAEAVGPAKRAREGKVARAGSPVKAARAPRVDAAGRSTKAVRASNAGRVGQVAEADDSTRAGKADKAVVARMIKAVEGDAAEADSDGRRESGARSSARGHDA
jgi:hypothetical protein